MKTILVGVDLSPESEHAVAHAVDLARRDGAKVVLAMADCVPELPAHLAAGSREVAASYTEELQRRLAADRVTLGELRERWSSGVDLSQVIVDGFADEELPRVGSEINADLIVVGSRGRTGVRRWLLGSVAERVVRRAEQSVLVARGDAVPGGYRRAVIGTDFSPLADAAVARALAVLSPQLRVDLVHCWQVPWAGTMDVPLVANEELRAQLEAALRDAGDKLRAGLRDLGRPEPELHIHLVQGSAAQGLVSVATDQHAELVVVGSHGRRGVQRFMLGSVAEVTVRHAPCSVLVGR